MSQSVKIAGALFQNVPSISVPDENDVYHGFFDTSDANATAADILSGKTAYVNGVKITGTGSGGGSSGLVYESGTYTPTADIARPTISFTNTHTTAPFYVLISDSTGTYSGTTNSCYTMMFTDFGQLYGGVVENSGGTTIRYGEVRYVSRSSSASSLTAGSNAFYTPSSDSRDTGVSYMRYWVKETGFNPYCGNTSRYWRAGRTYKWIAVWAPT